MEILISFLCGGCGAAVATGVFAMIRFFVDRKDEKSDKKSAERKALRYLMLYIIQERCKEHINDGKITLEDRRSLHHWHTLYHDENEGLGGNGDADALLKQVDNLQIITD